MKSKCSHFKPALFLICILSMFGSFSAFAETDTRTVITVGGDHSTASDLTASGPGVSGSSSKAKSDLEAQKGESLGIHTITGYDPTIGTMTYSGKTAQPNHTVAADLSLYPLGTKLWINGVIYEVEDCGSMVIGKFIDIFYATHEEAEALGMTEAEVFRVLE